MPITQVIVDQYTCRNSDCGRVWCAKRPGAPEPKTCPSCRSPYWNKPFVGAGRPPNAIPGPTTPVPTQNT